MDDNVSALNQRDLETACALGKSDRHLLERAIDNLMLSARATHKILKVSRTLADLSGHDRIMTGHLKEAISYRMKDGKQLE